MKYDIWYKVYGNLQFESFWHPFLSPPPPGARTLESGTEMCLGHDPLFSGQSALPSLPI